MNLIIVILFALFLGWIQKRFYRKKWNEGLSAQISFSKECVYVGEQVVLKEQVLNDKWLPLAKLHVKFSTDSSFAFAKNENIIVTDRCYRNDVFTLLMHQSTLRKLTFSCTKRGYFTIPSFDLIGSDLFLEEVYAMQMDNHCALYVYPKLIQMEQFPATFVQQMGDILTERSLFRDNFAFQGIREYRAGDAMKHVNWKRSAVHNELLVNTYQPCSNQHVTVVLNLDVQTEQTGEQMREYLIRIAATLCTYFLKQGCKLEFVTNGKDIITKEVIRFRECYQTSQTEYIYKGLARLEAKGANGNDIGKVLKKYGEQETSTTCYIFISNQRNQEVKEQVAYLGRKGAKVFWLLPEFARYQTECKDAQTILMEVPEHE